MQRDPAGFTTRVDQKGYTPHPISAPAGPGYPETLYYTASA